MKRMSKADRAKADAVYLAQMQETLPLAQPPAPDHRRFLRYENVPDTCPGCGRAQTLDSGWTLVFGDMIQCGACSQLVEVPRAVYEAYGRRIHAHFANKLRAGPVRRERDRGERGAR